MLAEPKKSKERKHMMHTLSAQKQEYKTPFDLFRKSKDKALLARLPEIQALEWSSFCTMLSIIVEAKLQLFQAFPNNAI